MKLKRTLCAIFAIAIIIGATNLGGLKAKAATLDEADLCLLDAINLMVDENTQSMTYDRFELYNYDLESFGYVYELHINGKTGFALMINRAYFYEVTELYVSKTQPYQNSSGVPVYLTPLSYIEYLDGEYYDIQTNEILDEETLLTLNEKGFGFEGGTPGQIVTEYITFDSRTVEQDYIESQIPVYYNNNSALSGTCAVVAGSIVTGYYSRWFPELTPNFVVGRLILNGTYYLYSTQGSPSKMQPVIDDLYVKMGTGVGGAGTTATGFRNGLTKYVNGKGRNLSYTSVVSNTTLNFDAFKNHITNQKPVVLFWNTYNIVPDGAIQNQGNADKVVLEYFGGLHVMIAYGYKRIAYYRNGNNFRTDTYVEVATGNALYDYGYVRVYDGAILQEGYAINIY